MAESELNVIDVSVLKVQPDDVIVLSTRDGVRLDVNDVEYIKKKWFASTGLQNDVVVLDGLELSIVRSDELKPMSRLRSAECA